MFQGKRQDRLEELYEAVDADEGGEAVNYRRLFDEDEDMNQGVFAETIQQQYLQVRCGVTWGATWAGCGPGVGG